MEARFVELLWCKQQRITLEDADNAGDKTRSDEVSSIFRKLMQNVIPLGTDFLDFIILCGSDLK